MGDVVIRLRDEETVVAACVVGARTTVVEVRQQAPPRPGSAVMHIRCFLLSTVHRSRGLATLLLLLLVNDLASGGALLTVDALLALAR